MVKTFEEKLNELSESDKADVLLRTKELELEELTLAALREKLGLSQSELAELLDVKQPAVSRLENRDNLRLNTLKDIVSALGGEMDIIIRVPNKAPVLLSSSEMNVPSKREQVL